MFKHRKLAGAALMLAMGAIVAAGCGGGDKKPAANDGKGGVKGDVMV